MAISPLRARRPPAPAVAAAAARAPQRRENRANSALVKVLYWLLIVRLIIPGSFDYDPNTDIVAVAQRDALFNKLTWITFLLLPLALIASRSAETMRLLRGTNRYFLALVAFATISVLWSVDSGATASRITHMFAILFICLAVTVVGWNPTRLQEITRPVLTVLLIGSLIFGLYAPDLAITPPTPPDVKGYWHGLTSQKNQLGSLASLGALLWIHGWAARQIGMFSALVGAGVSLYLLVLSRSSTALMATVLCAMMMLMMLRSLPPSLRRYLPYLIGAFVVITLAYSLAVLKVLPGSEILLKPIAIITGKDTTFTARTQIWEIIRAHIQLSPFIGTGYGGYWTAPVPTSPSYAFVQIMNFYPTESHNGYLDVINDLGYIGLLLLLGYLIVYIRNSLRLLQVNYTQATLYLALMFQQLLTNLSESHWFILSHDFVILTFATFALARTLVDAAPARRRRP
jgi:exopolysaccharide production protein ExoQ